MNNTPHLRRPLSRLLFAPLIGLLALMMAACISDAVTTSSAVRLDFSRDTVSFDTVFTDLGTPTARLIVRNPDAKGVVISSISLASESSCFSINVDGASGRVFSNVEIMGKDSIFVFIECRLPETTSVEPTLTEDRLVFTTNGNRQEVLLEAWGQNVRRMRGRRISADEHIGAELPVVVFDSLVVDAGATLSIEPGTKMLFHDGAELIVHGRLNACGTADRKINFRGDRLDNVLPNIGYDILAGQWKGVRLSATSFNNRIEFADIRSTSDGLRIDSCADASALRLSLLNSWLHNSQGCALEAANAKIEATGCVFSEAADAVVKLSGGEARFLQCTFANYYLFAAISNPIVTLTGLTSSSGEPRMKAEFLNSIIYGLAADLNVGDFSDTDVYFRNVSFKAKGEDDDHFISCLWECDPLFLTDRPRYYFNYHVAPDSPVIGKGNPSFLSGAALRDMNGVDRLIDGDPLLGAYARPESPTE
ncbi:MAG: hypothetical protein HDS79_06330 [Bacteroidales bacterium]|nr:hypothetical protein [Bacteroidales bacterium]